MKLIKQIYRDSEGKEWVIEKDSLPKKRSGRYYFWTADCFTSTPSLSFYDKSKRELLKIIEQSIKKHTKT